jgi:hypothetical protein
MSDYITCVYCDEPLKPAPTKRGWVKKDRTHGICFRCIESLHRTMVAHLKAEVELQLAQANDEVVGRFESGGE